MTAAGPADPAFDPSRYQDPETIAEILRTAQTIAVVGLSAKPNRPSHGVAAYLQRQGYRIIPVNPTEQEVLGERSYPSLRDVPVPVDIVDVFRRAEAVPEVARDAVAIGAKVLWLQLGIISPEAAAIAEAGGLTVIMDRCLAVDHQRWLRRR
ncbi:MAG: CoA-binding protein [Sphaerobacter sp.]|nr:CoA-binding protein [Sphaerobacter sp.]